MRNGAIAHYRRNRQDLIIVKPYRVRKISGIIEVKLRGIVELEIPEIALRLLHSRQNFAYTVWQSDGVHFGER